jgi:DNA polymerase-1
VNAADTVAVVALSQHMFALATGGATQTVSATELRDLAGDGSRDPRWVWWSAAATAPMLAGAGLRLQASWDLAAVNRLLFGGHRDDPGAVWAAVNGLPQPPVQTAELDLLDLDDDDGPVRRDGQLSRVWQHSVWRRDAGTAQVWAALALEVQRKQESALAALPDPRPMPTSRPLPLLTAYAESAAALLAVELGDAGLPVDVQTLSSLLEPVIGGRPATEREAVAQRLRRDAVVRAALPQADELDLRNPAKVREMLVRIGLDLPDTRSWRLAPHAASSPAVAALLEWRRAERLATTYGWSWVDRNVGPDGRLRGAWSPAEGAGRMTATSGLHNFPGELRAAVRAEPGHVLVRADLGQVEPRVLAVVSGDVALADATHDDDMYAPVAARLRCDRSTAKVAVLAAMYGQTSGAAGAALRQMDRAYGSAMRYLRDAEEAGRRGDALRTYGGRLLHMQPGWGRYARNAVVQGAAAELFKAWAATVRAGLRGGEQIVLCLHDELLLHVPAAAEQETIALLHRALGDTSRWWAAGSSVQFVAEVSSGPCWQ